MKNTRTYKNQKGIALIELTIALLVLAVVTWLAWPRILPMLGFGKMATIESHIDSIFMGTTSYITEQGTCTGISLATLGSRGSIDSRLASGTETNAWGGGFTVACNANVTQATITSTGIADAAIGERLRAKYARRAVSASFASGTLTVVVQG